MRIEEAQWIGMQLGRLGNISPVVNLGSSTFEYRTKTQPHVDRFIDAPMRERSIQVVHADYKKDAGVDIAGDIFDPRVQSEIRARNPQALLCCNMFEHVEDRKGLADFCANTVPEGGYLVVTGPFSYPLHMDPIDTYFRPTPAEVASMFPGFEIVASEVVRSSTYAAELLSKPSELPKRLLRHVYRLARIWDKSYAVHNHRLLWLFRRYKVYCVVLRKR